jgi:hypothetical protein
VRSKHAAVLPLEMHTRAQRLRCWRSKSASKTRRQSGASSDAKGRLL